MMLRKVSVITTLLIMGAACAQQDEQVQTYDLQQVVTTALENHSSLRMSASEVMAARAQVGQMAAHFRPQINAQAGYALLEEAPSFAMPNMGTLVFGEKDNWTLNLALQYPLYTGGKLEAMKSGAQSAVVMANEDLQRQRQTVANNAAQAYFRAWEARRMMGVLDEQITMLEEAVRVSTAMYEQGVVAKIDMLRPTVALGGARNALVQVQTGYATALAALVEAMGLPPGTPIDIAEAPLDRAAPGSPDEEWRLAWQLRPEVRNLQARKSAVRAQLGIARSQLRPQVGLWARSEFERPTSYSETGTMSGGLMLTQTLTDGGASRAAVREAKARLDQLDAADEYLRYGIAVQVRAAINQIESAQARADTAAATVELAREALRLAQVGYANEVSTMLDVLQAQTGLTAAAAEHEGALSSIRQAYAEYDYAMGRIVGKQSAASPPAEGE